VTFDKRHYTSYARTQASRCGNTFACATAKIVTHFIISIAVLKNVRPGAGLQKRATFSTLNVGLARTGNWTRATYVASSVARRSAIHYALTSTLFALVSILSGICFSHFLQSRRPQRPFILVFYRKQGFSTSVDLQIPRNSKTGALFQSKKSKQ
jgi:hypothetical protein